MADSKHYRVMADLSRGMQTAGGQFGSQSPVPHKLVNLMPDNGLLVNFGGKQSLWGETWTPSGGFADLYDWSVDARDGIAATTYRIAADGHGRLYLESQYTGEYDGLYDPNDDPAVAASSAAPGVSGFAEYAGYLFIGGIGRPVTDTTSGVTVLAPVVLDGYLWRLTGSTTHTATVAVTGDISDVRLGDRLTLTDGTTGAMETRTVLAKGSGTLTVDRAFTGTYADAPCVVAGVHYLGVLAPASAPTATVGAYSGGLEIGVYLYKYAFECDAMNVGSDPSPEVTATINNTGQTQVTLSGWGAEPADSYSSKHGYYRADRLHIYRSENNGDTFYRVATLKRDQAGYTFPTEYVDKISDAALTGTPSFNLVAVEQAMPGTPGDMTLKASPGVPRKVNVTVMNRTEDADYMHMHEAVYTVTGTLADGTSTTDTLRFDVVANKQMPAVPGALSISRQPSVPTTLHCAVYNSTSGELPNDQVHFLVSGRLSDDTESTEDIVIGMNAGILSHANAYSNGSKVWKQIDSITVDVTQAAGLQYWVSEHLALNGEVRIQGVKEFVTVTEIAFDAVQNTGWAHKAGIGSGEAEPYSYVNRQPAPAVRAIRTYNDRLWGINSHYGGYLAFSSLAQPEYWPLLEAVPTDTGKLVDGGAVQIGSAGDCITGFVPEVGAYSSQGRTGSALLVFTTRGATRIFGRDWTDFKVDAAYPVGCIAGRSIVNARGVIIWRSRDGIMTCPAGGSQPVCVSDVIPEFFAPSLAQSGVAAGGHITSSPVDNDASDVAVFWQGIYIIACGGDGNPYAMVYSPGSGWFGLSYLTDATGFHVTESAKGYGDLLWCTDDGLFRMSCGVLGGDHTTDGDATGNGATGEAWKLLLGPVGNLKDNSLVGRLTVKRVLFLVENGDSAAEVKLILYPMGSDWNLSLEDPHPLVNSDTGATTATKTIAAAPTGKRALRAVEWYPNSVCRYPAVGLSGSSAVDFSIKAVQIDLAAVGSDDIA